MSFTELGNWKDFIEVMLRK
ncbi:protein YpfM [Escherichia coli]